MLKISKSWLDEDFEKYPSFSKIFGMLGNGFIIMLTLSIFLIPVYLLLMIPNIGIVIADVWILLFIFIVPYSISRYSETEKVFELFNFSILVKFIQENTLYLAAVFFVNLISLVIVSIAPFLLIYAGRIIMLFPQIGAIWKIFGGLSIVLGVIFAIIGLIYWLHILFSLSGNIYALWLRTPETEKNRRTKVSQIA